MVRRTTITAILLLILALFSGCKKDNDAELPVDIKGRLYINSKPTTELLCSYYEGMVSIPELEKAPNICYTLYDHNARYEEFDDYKINIECLETIKSKTIEYIEIKDLPSVGDLKIALNHDIYENTNELVSGVEVKHFETEPTMIPELRIIALHISIDLKDGTNIMIIYNGKTNMHY